ncbi:hypothetical protein D3C76_635610 [compost metagenome]
MVVAAQFDLAVAVGGVVFLGLELAVAVGLHGVVAFVADADLLVVFDVLVPVALGVEEDLFLALAVLDAQFVETTATGVAVGLEYAARLVRRQGVGHLVLGVVEAARNQRLVGVAFEEADQHFHADAGDGDGAVAVAGPAAGDAQPAAGLVVRLAFAVPEELDLHPAVLVAMDFLALGAGDHGALVAQDARLGMGQRWSVGHVPGRGQKAVAVALVEVVLVVGDVAGDGFLQHLGLPAFVHDFGEQPEVVPVLSRMPGKRQEVAAGEVRLIAAPFGQPVVGTVTFEGALAEVPAALAIRETPRIVIVLEAGADVAVDRAFQLQPGLLEVVVAAGDTAGAGFQAQAEALDHRGVGEHAGILPVAQRRQLEEAALVVAEHQQMALRAVAEVIVDAFLLAQALDEVQVGLVVLGAVVAPGVEGRAELETVGVGENAVFFQHAGDDLGHRQLLEDALVDAVGEVGQLRHQHDVIAAQALAGITLGHAMDLSVDAGTAGGEGEEGALVQQLVQLQIRALADQFDFEPVGSADAFVAAEFEHLQIGFDTLDAEAEMGLVGGVEHVQAPCSKIIRCAAGTSGGQPWVARGRLRAVRGRRCVSRFRSAPEPCAGPARCAARASGAS